MIVFFNKKNGEIFGTIDGRVHNGEQLKMYVSDDPKMEIGKYIIGFLEGEDGKRVGQNLDKMELLEKFEDITKESPLDYKVDVESGDLIKIKNKIKN
jgi:hypothetical protein